MSRGWMIFSMSLCFVLFGCSDTDDVGKGKIVSQEKMQAVMWDIFQADAFTQNFIKKDSSKNDSVENAALQTRIFYLHKIKKEDYYTSYRFYASQPNKMKEILDSITVKAERNRGKLMEEKYKKLEKVVD